MRATRSRVAATEAALATLLGENREDNNTDEDNNRGMYRSKCT